jgi:hypothetical protein
MLDLPTALTYGNNFLAISRRQWADFAPPVPPEVTPTVQIAKIKLIHFFFSQLEFFLTHPQFNAKEIF